MPNWDIKAFPYKSAKGYDNFGMDLRDYFAAHAMQALISRNVEFRDVIKFSYMFADEMIKHKMGVNDNE